MSTATNTRAPLLSVLARARSGRSALAVALLGSLAEHGGAIVAGAVAGWLVGVAASGGGDLGTGVAVVVGAVLVSALGNWLYGQFGHAFAFRSQADLRLRIFDGLARSAPREMAGAPEIWRPSPWVTWTRSRASSRTLGSAPRSPWSPAG